MSGSGATLAMAADASRSLRPMSYLRTDGPAADPITALNWGLLSISVAVTVIIAVLVVVGVWRRRAEQQPEAIGDVEVVRRGDGVRWIWIGVGASSVVLLASAIWTIATLSAVAHPATPPLVTIDVTGEQWWWRAKYLDPDPRRTFVTANELHVPVGRPVRIRLGSADVIHSFWIPALAGKTDLIPGRVNYAWLQADRPGRYRGQCVEYCGQQHAHMVLWLVAEPPATFERWRRAQAASARPPADPAGARGQALFVLKCGACHTVRGTDAGGATAPDLTHLMSRATLAGGAIPNTPGDLSGWIGNPQGVKPGTHMPTLFVSGPELSDLRAYLLTLR